ncbi:MAG: Nisin biosynthesis protein NisB [Flavobacteriales bacterium]|nr:Nisin biosynthesis protein NisB [Flavobacteriales bacterium]
MIDYLFNINIIFRTPLKFFKSRFNKEELQQFFTQKDVQEALFLSSPNLLSEFKKWQNGGITAKTEEEKLIFSLLKYALRMHSRCTPYGLFASCGVVENNDDNNIIISKEDYKRSTRLDMNFTCALALELAKKPFIQPFLKFYPNTSIYRLHDKIRYIEYFYRDKRRIHQISAVDNSDYLQQIIEKSKQGATLRQLAELLTNEEIGYTEAEAFVKEIIDAEILVSELEPSVTGEELLIQILNVLINIRQNHPNVELNQLISVLQFTQNNLLNVDVKIGNEINIYENIADYLKQLNIPFELNKLFQTDLFLSNKPSISETNEKNKNALTKALRVLNKLSFIRENANLKSFKESFYQRYEDQEVLLAEVLDNETGIGYSANNNQTGDYSPLVEQLILPASMDVANEFKYYKQQSFLFKKLIKAHQYKEKTISIKEEDVKEFEEDWSNLPESISVMYSHLGIKNGESKLSLASVGGSSAINLLGRFGAGNKDIEEVIREVAQHEQNLNPDKIIASVLHLPESRTGNILFRPIIREYEIPYLSKSTLPQEQQILLDDLFVSVRNNKIILRSKRLNKEVIPRLDNAHNYSYNALPVYHFLCDLQIQNLREGLFFDWGSLKNEFSFLPRVEIENVVINSATWQLQKEQFKILFEKNNINKDVIEWQEKWQIPDLILLVEGDNELLIDLKNDWSLKMFISEIKNQQFIVLKEFLFEKETAFVKDNQGNSYTNEFIAILQKNTSTPSQTKESEDKQSYSATKEETKIMEQFHPEVVVSRSFPIGSEWLYYKIYCGVKTADNILTAVIKPLTELLIKQQLIDSWFFIRYADPDVHLRIRFHFSDTSKIGEVIRLFYKAVNEYQVSGLIWKIQTDTYQREIERYGKLSMILSEQLFFFDSSCTINLLSKIKGNEGEELRWLFGIKAVDELLNVFQYTTEQKLYLLEKLKTGFAVEFNMNKSLKIQLDKKYRDKRNIIEIFLLDDTELNKKYGFITTLLNTHKTNISPVVQQILNMGQSNMLELPLNDLSASYIHMLLNRLFKNKQRLHEMVVYDFMWRTYRSVLAKEKQLAN